MSIPLPQVYEDDKGLHARLEGGPRCDFCGTGVPVYCLLAREFDEDVPIKDHPGKVVRLQYGARWAACQSCQELIVAENWPVLLEAAVDAYALWTGEPLDGATRAALRAQHHNVHDLFRIHRLPVKPLPFRPEE